MTAKGHDTEERPSCFTVRVVEGPDTGRAVGVDSAHPGRVLVGTSQACDLRLSDPQVSSRHCALEATPRGLHVVDLASSNGTSCGRTAVVDGYVAAGERIGIGATVLVAEAAVDSPAVCAVSTALCFGRAIGASPAMRRLYRLCERVASSDVPAIIEGETGTGKELLAEELHEQGPRAQGPFVVFDCTAVPPTLVESTLFGHERGAFTGAITSCKGVFELADGGTLLIDEIDDLEKSLQPKLLRAIERGEVQRVGSET